MRQESALNVTNSRQNWSLIISFFMCWKGSGRIGSCRAEILGAILFLSAADVLALTRDCDKIVDHLRYCLMHFMQLQHMMERTTLSEC